MIGDEDPAQFDVLRAELTEQYDPQSVLEFELVERISGLLWRLRRVPAFEAAIIEARGAEIAQFSTDPARSLGAALIRDGAFHDTLGKLARHEATLMNAFTKALQMLLLLEERRLSEESENLTIEAVALPPKG